MAENSTNRPAEFSCFKEAVCINAQRIYDSCSDKDCLEDLQVFSVTRPSLSSTRRSA